MRFAGVGGAGSGGEQAVAEMNERRAILHDYRDQFERPFRPGTPLPEDPDEEEDDA